MDRIVKGIIMEISDKNVVLMTADGEFLRVKKPPTAIALGDEITAAVSSKTTAYTHKKHMMKYASIAALILVLLIPFVYFKQVYATVAYINVDINPSIEIGINRYNKVSETRALNDDGRRLLDGMNLNGLDIENALDSVIDKAKESGYIGDDKENNIEVALVALDDKEVGITEETIARYVKDAVQGTHVDASIKVQKTDKKTHDDAANENMSTNKYLDKTNIEDNSIKVDVKKQDSTDKNSDEDKGKNYKDNKESTNHKKAPLQNDSKDSSKDNTNNSNDKVKDTDNDKDGTQNRGQNNEKKPINTNADSYYKNDKGHENNQKSQLSNGKAEVKEKK